MVPFSFRSFSPRAPVSSVGRCHCQQASRHQTHSFLAPQRRTPSALFRPSILAVDLVEGEDAAHGRSFRFDAHGPFRPLSPSLPLRSGSKGEAVYRRRRAASAVSVSIRSSRSERISLPGAVMTAAARVRRSARSRSSIGGFSGAGRGGSSPAVSMSRTRIEGFLSSSSGRLSMTCRPPRVIAKALSVGDTPFSACGGR